MIVTRRFEFDAGHRIPDHRGQCRNLHGHRYAIEMTFSGTVDQQAGGGENGMVLDFAKIKELARASLIDGWDHAFLAYAGDRALVEFLATIPNHKTVLFDCVPTAENLANTAFNILDRAFGAAFGDRLRLTRVRLYETPNCWADAIREQDMF